METQVSSSDWPSYTYPWDQFFVQPAPIPNRGDPLAWRALLSFNGDRHILKVQTQQHDTRIISHGRRIDTIIRHELLQIAWTIGVTNLEGFTIAMCTARNLSLDDGFVEFTKAWVKGNKTELCNAVWTRFEELGVIEKIPLPPTIVAAAPLSSSHEH
jgi:hypothetical protein